ncbi:dienelactone hydrolase family protein [Fodinibius sediminis]|uniref:Dienelactone hydrolase n=1 Tax=Fodinibius sediminis TaxID=1214077 RepID=A0A521BPM0_9BACT|nr:alpha/beta hydrolase [Fodinibius sediminis]SMO49104.1 Dienelactone hydrolase [Fodinibius sediminis]
MKKEVDIPANGVTLKGDVHLPEDARGLVIFSHGSGSSRLSPRNRFVAGVLEANGFATLLFDLLTPEEDLHYKRRFDIELLTRRLVSVSHWIHGQRNFTALNKGFFGASTGAASALRAAAILGPDIIKTVVSRGGRPDMAMSSLATVEVPTLLLVGGLDTQVIELNEQAYRKLHCVKELKVILGASHLFEESGKLEQMARYANKWFLKYLYRYQINIEKEFLG